MIGETLGHYRIVEKIGAGGMGVVYRARDARLGRDVAIKVLPEALSGDPQRLQRFEREAQLLASLNHPNIATIHGLEEGDGRRALVMELVEGPTLGGRLGDRPIPLDEALPLARQIADALEYAHERGVIHRDLKPANIKVKPDGTVKVLDFGLAKALEGDPAQADPSTSPTISAAATRAGVILGTAAYMSPEQARGRGVDKRADIWAFGCVLYEMLAGRQTFEGDAVSEVLASVLKTEPDWNALPAATPAALRKLLRRCLEKDPKRRLQAIGEARIVIEEALAGPAQTSGVIPAVTAAQPAWKQTLPWALAAVLAVVAAGAFWGLWRASRPAPALVKRFAIMLPGASLVPFSPTASLAVSPDGSHIAYEGSVGKGWWIYLRAMDELDSKQLPGTEDGRNPFFSPGGKWVGFFAAGKLKKVSVLGGAPVTLCDAFEGRGATWGPDDTIVFAPAGAPGLFRVSANGGPVQKLTTPDRNRDEESHRLPEFLPGGQAVLLTVLTGASTASEARIAVLSLKTGEWRTLVEGGSHAHYSPTGHIVYSRNATLMAVPFDLSRLEVAGAPVPLIEGVPVNFSTGAAQYSLSAEGTLVYIPGSATGSRLELVWVDRQGTAQPLKLPANEFDKVSISPDGKRIAVNVTAQNNTDIWVSDLARGTLTRLTFQPGEDETPVWTPDGKRVVYSASVGNEPRALYWKNGDGSGNEEKIVAAGAHTHLSSVSSDGKLLAFTNYETEARGDIWLLPLTGERKLQVFLKTPFNEREPKISPDGRWIAYSSDESGRDEIYVQALPALSAAEGSGSGGKYQISTEGGYGPLWARNGRELFYRNANQVMAVAVTIQPSFTASQPRALFEGRYEYHPRREGNYDVAPDGQRFLMVKASAAGAEQSELRVVLNWFEELKRAAPAGQK